MKYTHNNRSVSSLEEGAYIPFCLKQDHIGAVSIYRLFLYACAARKKPTGSPGSHELLSLLIHSNHFVHIALHLMVYLGNHFPIGDNGLIQQCIQKAQSIGIYQETSASNTFLLQILEYFFEHVLIGPQRREQ
jgi:hypothetical protein